MAVAHPPPHASDAHQARRALPERLQIATASAMPAVSTWWKWIREKRLWFTAFQNSSLAASGAGIDPGLLDVRFPITPERLVGWAALYGEVLNLPAVHAIPPDRPYRFDAGLDRRTGYRAVSLRTMAGEVVGVMQLIAQAGAGAGRPR